MNERFDAKSVEKNIHDNLKKMMEKFIFLSVITLFSAIVHNVAADTPANCTFEDVLGDWIFYEGERGHSPSIDCSNPRKTFFTNFRSLNKIMN